MCQRGLRFRQRSLKVFNLDFWFLTKDIWEILRVREIAALCNIEDKIHFKETLRG